ncbi:MAG: GNAT family N-acetyltransferase [Candidatus Eisenbacteria bacterium]|mgnify:CR=1 FL=1|nr:GNAT family N-acetyltransferase [Candidatus Eisenbacteria bacterium]
MRPADKLSQPALEIVLATPRLRVRHFEEEDVTALFEVCRDPVVMRWVGDGTPLTLELCAKWIEISRHNYLTKGYGAWAVIDRESDELIGYAGLVHAPDRTDPEIICAFRKAWWGRGLASELAPAILRHGLTRCGLARIIATIDPANAASLKVVDRCGMSFETDELDEHGLAIRCFAVHRNETDPVIRNAVAGDIDLLVDLCAVTFRETYGPHSPAEEVERHIREHFTRDRLEAEVMSPEAVMLLATVADRPVGYAFLLPGSTTPCVTGPDPVQLARIYLSAGSIGVGRGSSLMNACLDEARRLRSGTIWLSLWDQNHRAMKFYERWGFITIGTMAFEFGGTSYQDPVMARTL